MQIKSEKNVHDRIVKEIYGNGYKNDSIYDQECLRVYNKNISIPICGLYKIKCSAMGRIQISH